MRLKGLLVVMLLLVFSGATKAQCFNPSFSTTVSRYWSTGTTWPPTTVYQQVVFSGTSGTNPSCPMGTNAMHHAAAYNMFNGVGGSTNGTAVCKTCFMTATGTVGISGQYLATSEDPVQGVEGGDAICTVAGNFFHVRASPDDVEFATIRLQNTGVPGVEGAYNWNVVPWCDASSTPPTVGATEVFDNSQLVGHPYYDGWTICYTILGLSNWHCLLPSEFIVYRAAGQPRASCTKLTASPPVPGFSFDGATWIAQQALGIVLHMYVP